jgi:hypothetical protein
MKARAVWAGIAIAILAFGLGYLALEGLLTGQTRAIAKNFYPAVTGARGIVVAASYGIGTISLALASVMCFTANQIRQDRLFAAAKWSGIVAFVVLFSSLVLKGA